MSSASNHNGTGENATVPHPEQLESDGDYAFRLQLMETMSASLSINQPKPSFTTTQSSSSSNDVVSDLSFESKLDYAIQLVERLKRDLNQDQKSQGECSRSVVDNKGVCRVYFKGLVEICAENGGKVAGIGVAICDKRDRVLFTSSKPVEGEFMNKRLVAVTALIQGLTAALDLGITHVVFYCDYYPIYMMVIGRWSTKQDKLGVLLKDVEILQKKFTKCMPSYVARSEVKFAYKLAREAMVSQTNKQAGSSGTKIESCLVCLEDVDACQIFSVDGCMHRYCFSCMKQHVEAKLLNAILPKCPHDGCTSVLELDSCQKFLTPKLIQIMSERLAEAAIPVTEKIYCPYPRCSALMSKNGILEYSKSIFSDAPNCGVRKCMKCHGLFCANCKVPWHNNMTCYAFKNNNVNQHAEDVKLKTLAEENLWRQCVKCNHMIELTKGCYHMTCRCGFEFCYTCGSEWKNKKATCTCPLWSNDYILDDDSDDDYIGEFEMEVGNDDDFFDFEEDDFDFDLEGFIRF